MEFKVSLGFGEYYGYPQCCIESFLGPNCALNHAKRFEDVPFGGTGFIPCQKCATERTEEEILSEIASRRKCPTPFPDDSGAEQFRLEVIKKSFNDPAGDGHYQELYVKPVTEW